MVMMMMEYKCCCGSSSGAVVTGGEEDCVCCGGGGGGCRREEQGSCGGEDRGHGVEALAGAHDDENRCDERVSLLPVLLLCVLCVSVAK